LAKESFVTLAYSGDSKSREKSDDLIKLTKSQNENLNRILNCPSNIISMLSHLRGFFEKQPPELWERAFQDLWPM